MSQPPPFEPYPFDPYPAASHLPPEKTHPVDMAVTIIELVLLTIGTLVVALTVLFLGALIGGTDTCSESGCNDDDGLVFAVSLLLPFVLTAVAAVWSIIRLVRRRIAFWIPPLALVLWAVVQILLIGRYDG